MSTRIIKLLDTLLNSLCRRRRSSTHPHQLINRHRTNQPPKRNLCPILQMNQLALQINLDDPRRKLEFMRGEGPGDGLPDSAGSAVGGESESRVGTPVSGCFVQDDVFGDEFEVWGCDSFAEPAALHACCWYGPYFKVVWTHEQICNSLAWRSAKRKGDWDPSCGRSIRQRWWVFWRRQS
jgi:hypothetical protein